MMMGADWVTLKLDQTVLSSLGMCCLHAQTCVVINKTHGQEAEQEAEGATSI